MKKTTATKSYNFAYNKALKKHARSLRKDMTKAEASLWKYGLKARKMKGYQFRRQRPVLNYIADFLCTELMLVVEVDGFTHQLENVILKDEKRQGILEDAGFTVLRFTDDEVLKDIKNVIYEIETWIDQNVD